MLEEIPDFDSPAEYLFYAVRTKRLSFINTLVKDKDFRIDVTDNEGQTPLHIAAQSESPDAIRTLLRVGCAVETVCEAGQYKGMTAYQICQHRQECRQVSVPPSSSLIGLILVWEGGGGGGGVVVVVYCFVDMFDIPI